MRILKKDSRSSLWIRAEMNNLHAISRFVKDCLAENEAYRDSPEQSYLVELAVIEGCTNVIRHATLPRSAEIMGITMKRLDGTIEILILDRGDPFDPTRVSPPNLDEPGEGGYGIHLIQTIMHKVRYHRRGEHWNVLQMTHDLSQAAGTAGDETGKREQGAPDGGQTGRGDRRNTADP